MNLLIKKKLHKKYIWLLKNILEINRITHKPIFQPPRTVIQIALACSFLDVRVYMCEQVLEIMLCILM